VIIAEGFGRTFVSEDGVWWTALELAPGPWRFDECMTFGHEEWHDGLCARCRQREEAGE
jgi:hypothetical protein